ncbi:MAG: radical SAM protein [Candidatus Gorgyraea atricola]|nr:radical SAM protein [Candidatus Gorgyraea atricola]
MQSNLIKKLHFLKSMAISNFRRLSFPLKISYVVTYRCNLKCKMCNIWQKRDHSNELTLNEVDNFFKKANKFSWVGITGGEAFLRPDLKEIIDIISHYCKRLGAVHISTNGQLTDRIVDLTKEVRKKDKDLKLVYSISIDGPPSLHDEIRGVEGAWARAIETFKRLKDMELVRPQLDFTLSAHNMDKFSDTFAVLKDTYPGIKFDDIIVNVFQRSSLYYGNQDMEPLDNSKVAAEITKILEMDKEGFSINNFLRRRYLKLYLKYIKTDKCPLKCQAFSSSCFLDPYGDLFPCTMYNKRLMNIRDLKEDFSSIWNQEDARRLSYECSNHMCPSCWSPCDAYSAIAGSLIEACLA